MCWVAKLWRHVRSNKTEQDRSTRTCCAHSISINHKMATFTSSRLLRHWSESDHLVTFAASLRHSLRSLCATKCQHRRAHVLEFMLKSPSQHRARSSAGWLVNDVRNSFVVQLLFMDYDRRSVIYSISKYVHTYFVNNLYMDRSTSGHNNMHKSAEAIGLALVKHILSKLV